MSNYHHRWCGNCKKMTVHDSGVCIVCKGNPDLPKPEEEKKDD